MSRTSTQPVAEAVPSSADGVVRWARAAQAAEDQAGRDKLRAALQWASIHAVDPDDSTGVEVCEYWRRGALGSGFATSIAGEGAPLTSEVAVAEFAAALGMSTDAGKRLVGDVVELAFRLRRCWARVSGDEVPGWRARQVADLTKHLSVAAARYVDVHLAPALGRVGVAQIQRLVEEAESRFMPDLARRKATEAADGRYVWVDAEQASFTGTARIFAEVDLADAYDFETAVAVGAEELRALGSVDSLTGRRASAIGEMARSQLTLAFDQTHEASNGADSAGAAAVRRVPSQRLKRRLRLYVHLSASAITNNGSGTCRACGDPLEVARVESARNTIVTADQVRNWCGSPDVQVSVQPVIDLSEHVRTESYEIPDRIREQVALRDGTCAFPWCTRPARNHTITGHLTGQLTGHGVGGHDTDCDHIHPWHESDPGKDGGASHGGQTCTCNLAPLCRTHHRLKTHHGWTYHPLETGTYLWRSPQGHAYLRDHTGTTAVEHRRR